jgi:hypothetical protein
MSTARRRLIRPLPAPSPVESQRYCQVQKLRSRLEQERLGLARWMSRLRRAFHAVEKHQSRITRIERQITRAEE